MILIENFVEDAMRKAKRLSEGECVDARTHKRDRGVIIEKKGEFYTIHEDGFYNEVIEGVSFDELEKILKKIKKREFPNSRVVHFYHLNRIEEVRDERRH